MIVKGNWNQKSGPVFGYPTTGTDNQNNQLIQKKVTEEPNIIVNLYLL